MKAERLEEITKRYSRLKIAVVGDLCLDRYFEIDPVLQEVSIETNLPVHNITRVRCQPGGAGTILNNLAALGVGEIHVAAIIGKDGEGFELRRSLRRNLPRLKLDYLLESEDRSTFTYTKPLVMEAGQPPRELNRLDIKNWTETPKGLEREICRAVEDLARRVNAIILLDQVDQPGTGVIGREVLESIRRAGVQNPDLLVLADSRRGLQGWPPVGWKMNGAELAAMRHLAGKPAPAEARKHALDLALSTKQPVFVTLSEEGMVGARDGETAHVSALAVKGEIDVVGAGDAVTANLASALAAGANLREAMELGILAGSIVIHQLGTTGTATPEQMLELLRNSDLLEP